MTDSAASPTAPMCPKCGEAVTSDAKFCEACGEDLPPAVLVAPLVAPAGTAPTAAAGTCTSCGSPVAADGYCEQCGLKQPDPHDREEVDLGWVAGVTDRGIRHPHNEDAMAVSAPRPGLAVIVVCDGVSSSSNAEVAAIAAVSAAGPVLLDGAGVDAKAALIDAAAAAQGVVAAVPINGPGVAPSCTFVAAVLHDGDLTVGWLGDSRAYWLGAHGNERLTTDHSWATEEVAAGRMTEEQAEAAPGAHGITKWLGVDAPDTAPSTAHFHLPGPGRVIVCSDGLWNYASSADRVASLLNSLPSETTPLDAARKLTQFALDSGGQDNITVVVLAV